MGAWLMDLIRSHWLWALIMVGALGLLFGFEGRASAYQGQQSNQQTSQSLQDRLVASSKASVRIIPTVDAFGGTNCDAQGRCNEIVLAQYGGDNVWRYTAYSYKNGTLYGYTATGLAAGTCAIQGQAAFGQQTTETGWWVHRTPASQLGTDALVGDHAYFAALFASAAQTPQDVSVKYGPTCVVADNATYTVQDRKSVV